jgi:hypothetical protein
MFVTPNAVVVLDGASQPVPDSRDGGGLADTLGAHLRDRLTGTPGADLQAVLAHAIDPSRTVYWIAESWVGSRPAHPRLVSSTPDGCAPAALPTTLRDDACGSTRAVPEAAAHAVRARWDIKNLPLVMALTDGGGGRRRPLPGAARLARRRRMARHDTARQVDTVHHA